MTPVPHAHAPLPLPLPAVLSETELSNAFLGNLVEVCFATEDHQRTMEGLVRLGIGPFRVYTFDSGSTTGRTYRGDPEDWSLKGCFAVNNGLTYEIMQPLTGRTVLRDHLNRHGEGVHHLAFDCDGVPWNRRVETFAERGFPQTQTGRWQDQNAFSFFGTEDATTACFETYHFPEGFDWPEPDVWYPGPPPR